MCLVKKINKRLLTFDIKIEKRKFHYAKYQIEINNVDIDKVFMFHKVSLGKKDFKCLIVYRKNLPKMSCER